MFRSACAMIALVTFAAPVVAAPKHTKDTIETVRKNLDEGKAVLFDVREQAEWNAGHLEAALLVPLSLLQQNKDSDEFAKDVAKKVDEKKIIYCHCRSGGRVIPASAILETMGYDVRPLKWGFSALKDAGFEEAPQDEDE